MKNRKTRFIVSLALCLGVAIPAHAYEPKEASQSEVSKALGTAQKVIQATKYGVFFTTTNYFNIWIIGIFFNGYSHNCIIIVCVTHFFKWATQF